MNLPQNFSSGFAGRRRTLFRASLALATLTACGFTSRLRAQDYRDDHRGPEAVRRFDQLSPLDQLLAPVALYPDPIVALILPAATEPFQIRDAAREDDRDGDHGDRDRWSPAVRGLSHYPGLVRWMADNPDWTHQVGAAYATRPHETMDAIQELRRDALAAGTLHTRDQEQVVQENGIIQILPAQDDIISLPRYNPYRVYLRGVDGPAFTWTEGVPAGPWLSFYPAWDRREIWSGDWRAFRHNHGDNHNRQFSVGGFGITLDRPNDSAPPTQEWRPRDDSPALSHRYSFQDPRDISHPQVMRGAPDFRRDADRAPTFQGDDRGRADDRPQDDRRSDSNH